MDAPEHRLPPGSAGFPAGFVAPPVGTGADKVNIGRLAQTLWRQKWLILGLTLVLWLPAVLLINAMTPLYSAFTVVVIDPHSNRVINIPSVSEPMGVFLDTVNTEVEILRSRDLSRRVVETLNLGQEPEYAAVVDKPGLLTPVLEEGRALLMDATAALPEPLSAMLTPPPRPAAPTGNTEEMETARLISAFQKNLRIIPGVQSRAIRITVEAKDPQLAARAANAVADAYLALQVEAKRKATQNASEWLQSRLDELRQDMTTTGRAAVEAMRSESGMVKGRDAPLVNEEMSALNAQLAEARTAHANAQARLRQLQSVQPGNPESLTGTDIGGDPLITGLRQRQTALSAQLAELRAQYGDRHPALARPTAELRELNAALATEVDRVVRSLRGEVEQQVAKIQNLSRRLETLRTESFDNLQADVRLRELQRQADASDDNYRRAVTRLKETQVLQALEMTPDVRIVSAAAVPVGPVGPGKTVLAGLAAILCGAIATGIALVRTSGQRGVYSSHQVEAVLGLPAVGIVPMLGRGRRSAGADDDRYSNTGGGDFAEAVWRLCARLHLVRNGAEPATAKGGEVVMLTSSVAGEGKTTLAVALSAFLADTGRRVVIVDCDTRRPTVHRLLGGNRPPKGLTDLLEGDATLDQVVQVDDRRRVAVIAAGRTVDRPQILLGSKAMLSLLVELAERYDVIVLDTPPVLSVSDALILAPLADRVLYVVRWARTASSLASAGIKQVRQVGGRIGGAVLSMVNAREHANLEYGTRPPSGRSYRLRRIG
ncbi:polysaccharide biosynthesis tyrosine autokinase [Azospirillum sp. YIM B02556]|uniref:non-specific protein-tyrosine kinase n=1 Tax=Azospirillum endophyticum TaxID=2800326 RepID=A0ABS1F1J0_9PROT|nr:polysaccharide biosynthesis tyrosine autokinase [Azospirillum endophyticum]MBK1837284.1 polysaccharide biosynthesis tyrosine autokinase [Azospirillum endophyticum]